MDSGPDVLQLFYRSSEGEKKPQEDWSKGFFLNNLATKNWFPIMAYYCKSFINH